MMLSQGQRSHFPTEASSLFSPMLDHSDVLSTLLKKWRWPSAYVCEYKSPICTATKILNSCQYLTNVQCIRRLCGKISILQWNKQAKPYVVMTSNLISVIQDN
jgi:hypothetical protein